MKYYVTVEIVERWRLSVEAPHEDKAIELVVSYPIESVRVLGQLTDQSKHTIDAFEVQVLNDRHPEW